MHASTHLMPILLSEQGTRPSINKAFGSVGVGSMEDYGAENTKTLLTVSAQKLPGIKYFSGSEKFRDP